MPKTYKILLLIFLAIVFLASCADDPNSVGSALIPEEDQLASKKIDSFNNSFEQSFVSFKKDSLFFGSSTRLLLGSYKNITSEALIKFFIQLPDSIEEGLTNGDMSLKSSWIEIFPNYWIGDSNGFNVSIHSINNSWNPIEFSLDTLNLIHNGQGTNILEELSYQPGDTVMNLYINTEPVRNWVFKSFDESYPENYGILFSPQSNNGIIGFQGLTNFPGSIYPTLNLEFEKNGSVIDTILAVPNLDLHVPVGERLPEPSGEIILQSSLGIRGKLKISLEQVPQNILVNSAVLDLFIDDGNTFIGTVKTDTIAATMLYDFVGDSLKTEFGRYPIVKKGDKYTGELKQFVQRWIEGEPNEGMELKLTDESRSASTISLFGSDYTDASLRPRLTLYYTTK